MEVSTRGWEVLRTAVRPHLLVGSLGILTGLIWTAGKLAVPALIAHTIDTGIVPADHSRLRPDIIVLAVVGLAGALVAGLRRFYAQLLAFLVERDIRARLVSHVHTLDLGFHNDTPTGLLVTRAGSDLQQIQQPFIGIPLLLSAIVMFVGAAVLLALIDVPLTLVALLPTSLIFFVAVRFTSRLGPRSHQLQNRLAGLAGVVEESLSGIRAIKGLGSESVELARLEGAASEVYDAAVGLGGVRATYLPLFDLLPALGIVATLMLGAQRVADGSITVGELVQFNAYVLMLASPLRMVGTTLSQLQRALVSAGLIGAVLDAEPAVADPGCPRSLPAGAGAVRFEGVDFAYPGGETVLHDIDLDIPAGSTVALVGATGAGKSTVAALVNRLYDPTRGRVSIDGVDVRELRLAEVRAAVSAVFEAPILFSGTVAENIGFAATELAEERLLMAAEAAGAHEFVSHLDGGYDAELGERGLGLSGGQRQRIAIARALAADSRVLVLDSATSAVDAVKEAEIRDAITRVAGHRTTLLIAHRAATIALADKVVLLHEGRIVATGTHTELMASSALYRGVLATADTAATPQAGGRMGLAG